MENGKINLNFLAIGVIGAIVGFEYAAYKLKQNKTGTSIAMTDGKSANFVQQAEDMGPGDGRDTMAGPGWRNNEVTAVTIEGGRKKKKLLGYIFPVLNK